MKEEKIMSTTTGQEKSIKELREAMGLTQTEFADILGERQDTISRWENTDPDELSLPKKTWNKIEKLIGKALKEPRALNVADKWQNAELMRQKLLDYLEEKGVFLDCDPAAKEVYRNLVKNSIRKPRVAFVGLSDVGKSTMINCLLGSKKMPAAWTPVTAITVYIKHRNDRPDFIKDTTWVFRSDGTEPGFDLSHLDDEDKCNELCVGKGDAEILRDYGVRDGDKHSDDVVAAVVYLDSPILKNVDLVDLPGYGTGDREADEVATRGIGEFADVLLFLSRSNGFLSGQETTALRIAIQGLPCFETKENGIAPLGNLFVVASQAHIVGNDLSIQKILNDGRIRFEKTLPSSAKEFFAERSRMSGYGNIEKHFQNRFFSYTADAPEFREKIEIELRMLIERLPQYVIDKTSTLLQTYSKEYNKKLDSELKVFTEMLNNKATLERDLAILLENEPVRKEKNKSMRKKIVSAIKRYSEHSVTEFREAYSKVVDVDFIVNAIKEKGFKKKKDDLELLINHLGARLEDEADKVLSKYAVELNESIDEYLGEFENSATADGKIGINVSIPFNAKRVFISGMAGLLTFGGLALWASTLGNLAGYIIVAKGVSLLSALGISLGGTAAVMSFVAAIGGPITLFIAAAILVAGIFFGIFSGGWQKSVAKKLVKEYDKAKALKQYEAFITKFWLEDTITAFNTAADAMEEEWLCLIENHKELVNNSDVDDIQRKIKEAEDMKSFLSNIPLSENGLQS
jgi:transcriptional regulator with XRE-family HTH domain